MSAPYFETEEIACEFYQLIGRILLAWGALERSVDVVLWTSRSFNKKDGRAILAWSKKIDALRIFLNSHPKLSKKWCDSLISRLGKLADVRNTLIHGYCSGTTDAEPTTIIFRAARFHAETSEHKQLSLSGQDLIDLINEIQDLEDELMPVTFNQFGSRKRTAGEA